MERLNGKKYGTIKIILMLFAVAIVRGIIPEDKKPERVYGVNDTQKYAIFVGTKHIGETPELHYVQGMTKVDGDYVIHARDNIFFVDLLMFPPNATGEIPYKQVFRWPSDNVTIELCGKKGKSTEKCHNYVKIFVRPNPKIPHSRKAITCGSNSFYAQCKHLERMDNGTWVASPIKADFDGKLFCPYDPDYSVAYIAADSNVYTGTSTGFSGHDSMIHRAPFAGGNDTNLRTGKSDNMWLNNPRFIRFANQPTKMFTFFTENGIEDQSYQVYSRVSQACKSDQGGVKVLRNHFTTFFKATLNCSIPGHPPFYFNEMSDVTDVVTVSMMDGRSRVRVVFAVMNTPKNSVPASAVCVFVVDDIEDSFSGPFLEKFVDDSRQYWHVQPDYPFPHPASCGSGSRAEASDSRLDFVRKHPLMAKSVNAWDMKRQTVDVGRHNSAPVFTRANAGSFLTTIDVDSFVIDKSKTVIYAGTQEGKLLKIVGDSRSGKFELLEERTVFNEQKCGDTDRSVQKLQVDKDSGKVFVQFKSCIVFAPFCPLTTTCRKTCLDAGDPHCVWRDGQCVSLTTANAGRTPDPVDNPGICIQPVVGQPPGVAPEVPAEETNNTVVKNETLVSKPEPTYVTENNATLVAAGNNWAVPGGIGLAVGFLLAVILFALFLIAFRCKREKSGKYPPKVKKVKKAKEVKKGKLQNGSAKKNQSRDSRRDSNQSRKGRNASSSSNSNNRQIGNRNSVHDESRRKRNLTESSMGNRSEEDAVFATNGEPLLSPESPNGRDGMSKHHLSTTSSNGGKRKMRNSHPSTSSAPEHADDMQLSPSKRSIDDMGLVFTTRGHDGDDLQSSTPTDGDQMLPPNGHQQRVPPVRAMSFQGQKAFNRTYSMDNTRATTMGHNRPNMRSIGRQHSLQQVRTTNQQSVYTHPMVVMSPQGPQPHGVVPTWTQAAPSVPQASGRYDKRMTHSLDRRQLLKGGQNYQLMPTEVFNDEPSMAPQQKNFQPQRKRNVSESAAGSIPTHVQLPQQRGYLAVVDEQEALMGPMNEAPTRPPGPQNNMREKLKLNIPPQISAGGQGPRGEIPMGNNGYSAFSRPPMDLMTPNRLNLRLNIPRSNPGTPQHETPPSFGEPPYSPSYINKGNTTFPSAQKNKRLPTQRSLEGQQRLSGSVGAGTPDGHSPSKSNPTSPIGADDREPVYPNQQERARHISGNSNKQITPSSPVKPHPPTSFGSQPPNNTNGMQRARHASGPESGRLVNNNQRTENVKRPQKAISVPDAPREFS
uniref:Semaphorin-6B-like n=1 Tax=Phallusia mammillata TaxID=59560 RepID=A0A6F9DR90_9ASCI|nr:semaphorin-6B-like [Phallusia mammillata]